MVRADGVSSPADSASGGSPHNGTPAAGEAGGGPGPGGGNSGRYGAAAAYSEAGLMQAIEHAIAQAVVHNPGDAGHLQTLLNARTLCLAGELAAAQQLLNDALEDRGAAEALLGIASIGSGSGGAPRAGLTGLGGRLPGGTASGSSAGGGGAGGGDDGAEGGSASGASLGAGGAAGSGLSHSNFKLKDWQGVIVDVLVYSKHDTHRIRQKLSYAIRLSQQNLLARSTVVPLVLQQILDTSKNAIVLQVRAS